MLPSRRRTRVASIDTFEGSLESAAAPLSVTLTLTDEVDISRGDMLVHPDDVPTVDRRFEATLVWMNERPLDLQKSYLLKQTTMMQRVEIEALLHRTNLDTLQPERCDTLELNDIGTVRVHCHRPMFFDPYRENRRTGAFVLIDSLSNGTVAAGVIIGSAKSAGADDRDGGLGRSMVSPREREERLGQRGAVVLLNELLHGRRTSPSQSYGRSCPGPCYGWSGATAPATRGASACWPPRPGADLGCTFLGRFHDRRDRAGLRARGPSRAAGAGGLVPDSCQIGCRMTAADGGRRVRSN